MKEIFIRHFVQPSLACSTESLYGKQKLMPALSFNKALHLQIFTLEVMNGHNNIVLPYFRGL